MNEFNKDTILIVDDEKEIRDLIDIYLKGEGYKTLKAERRLGWMHRSNADTAFLYHADPRIPVVPF